MKKCNYLIIFIVLAFSAVYGQSKQHHIDNAEKKTVIDSVCENLEREYIFPEITQKYIHILKDNLKSGKYENIREPEEFAVKITKDLGSIHTDEHLNIRYNPERILNMKKRDKLDEEAILKRKREDRIKNYGFEEIKILPGNIGYFKLNGFSYDIDAYKVCIGAMDFLVNTDALIIDLRKNGGGSPEMVQFLCSYFLDNPRKHLNSFYYKEKTKTTQYWTYTYLPGKRLDKIDLYLLTSKNTFSAAEEFSYNLKYMKRATVIGEATGGGAHDNKFIILNDNFMMSLPFARAVNPITKKNWEGVGVEPDIKISSKNAFNAAYTLALKNLFEKAERDQRESLKWKWEHQKALYKPFDVKNEILENYVGVYEWIQISINHGELFIFDPEEEENRKLFALSEILFVADGPVGGINQIRIQFEKDENGEVIGLFGLLPTGRRDRFLKSNNED